MMRTKKGRQNPRKRTWWSEGLLGTFTIALNRHLAAIKGFKSFKTVYGDVFIVGNPTLSRFFMEEWDRVTGITEVIRNNVADISYTKALPHFEKGCVNRNNTISKMNSEDTSRTAFMTKLEYNECADGKVIPTVVTIGTIAAVVGVSSSSCLAKG